MQFLSVAEMAEKWRLSERTVRNYCANGKIPGALLQGKTWLIPADSSRPLRAKQARENASLLAVLQRERKAGLKGGIYHKLQIEFTYNSNHIEGSRLSHEQTRYIFETNTLGLEKEPLRVDDVVETVNHFRCIDVILERVDHELTQALIKELHRILKTGTSDARQDWFVVGDYKRLPNEVGGRETTPPEEVPQTKEGLLRRYKALPQKNLEDLLDFHVGFERIHPFQDGNGRVGRLILLKECLRQKITPFIIDESLKFYYYRGLQEWPQVRGYLLDTCRTGQERFLKIMDYFRISGP